MENNLNREPDFNEAHKDPRQGNPQEDQRQQMEKGQKEKENKDTNKNWDQVQRRQQAGPRSYNTGLDEENKENQNTLADQEQNHRPEGEMPDDNEKEKSQGGQLVGDRATERQQNRDDEDEEPNSGGGSKERRVD